MLTFYVADKKQKTNKKKRKKQKMEKKLIFKHFCN